MMNIVFGGSFNPPQVAHEKIVNLLLNKFSDAKVIILPVGDDYKKPELISFKHRFKMLKLIFGDNERIKISKIEAKTKFEGTIASLEYLEKYCCDNLYFVTGSDNLKELKTWIRYEELIVKYPFIFIERDDDNLDELISEHPNLNKNYYKINFDEDISSSQIRNNLIENKEKLNKLVYEYILSNNLYGGKENV